MPDPIKWKVGKADEDWKVNICKRDADRAVDLIRGVLYVLGQSGRSNCTIEETADGLREFSGAQIADALLDYRKRALKSIADE